jgi:hypothetical protein
MKRRATSLTLSHMDQTPSSSGLLAQLRAAQLGGGRLTITDVPELDERSGSPAAIEQSGPVSAPERAAIESWDDEGGRNAP